MSHADCVVEPVTLGFGVPYLESGRRHFLNQVRRILSDAGSDRPDGATLYNERLRGEDLKAPASRILR
jgi:hypothetical protein